jgi:hypothetical protein
MKEGRWDISLWRGVVTMSGAGAGDGPVVQGKEDVVPHSVPLLSRFDGLLRAAGGVDGWAGGSRVLASDGRLDRRSPDCSGLLLSLLLLRSLRSLLSLLWETGPPSQSSEGIRTRCFNGAGWVSDAGMCRRWSVRKASGGLI